MLDNIKDVYKYSIILVSMLLVVSCAKTDIAILQKDMKRYSMIEQELNIKIKLVNAEMIRAIAEYKESHDKAKFNKDKALINNELVKLSKLAKEINIHIVSRELKKYNNLTIKLLEVQAEYVKVMIEQFQNMGEHGNNDAKATQLKYNRKIMALQKEQDKLLKDIIADMYK